MNFSEMQLIQKRKQAFEDYFLAVKKLRDLNIIVNKKDFTSQLGEWLISEMYGATIATNGKQKDWDMKFEEKHIQVKSHSKAKTTTRSNTDFKYADNACIDLFVIVIFDEDYKLKNIYEIPWNIALELKTKNTKDPVIKWNEIPENCKINFREKLKNNELLSSFL
ncbi:hypothetical protein [Flavobacterium sp. 102]|uniref:hypothetical protein n=1 Tax=Flavobacterium sp. 102 TaxID=2135623 RepID=UPI000EAEB8B4|nr:hypothetical protein [Flavobacterium sp. 102]RKS02841.1 hypothetical protein C8C84_2571 [Flavobacterium sp. 102]